jgi:hypothetical protein
MLRSNQVTVTMPDLDAGGRAPRKFPLVLAHPAYCLTEGDSP